MSRPENTSHLTNWPLSVGVRCHAGKVRQDNQDRVGRHTTPLGDFFVVADGVGGHQGGAEASRIVVEGFARHLAAVAADTEPVEALRAATAKVNSEVFAAGHAGDPSLQNMGSTVAFALLRDGRAVIGHVGDSRVYHLRAGRLLRVTRDHSAVQNLIDHGVLTEAQARNHPDASVLTRSLGQKAEVQVDLTTLDLAHGDILLLCSDGLWGCVNDQDIAAVAASPSLGAQGSADALLDLALRAGGPDNISIEYVRVGGGVPRKAAAAGEPSAVSRLRSRIPFSVLIGAVASLVVIAGLWALPHIFSIGRKVVESTHTDRDTTPGSPQPAGKPAAKPLSKPPEGNPRADKPTPGKQQTPAPTDQPGETASSRTRIGLLTPKAWTDEGAGPPWFEAFRKYSEAQVESIPESTLKGRCRKAVGREREIFYRGNFPQWIGLGSIIDRPARVERMPDGFENVCGNFDAVVLPAESDFSH